MVCDSWLVNELHWKTEGATGEILRFTFRKKDRLSQTSPFFRPSPESSIYRRPVVVLPLLTSEGQPYEIHKLEEALKSFGQKIIHALLERFVSPGESCECVWVRGQSAAQALELQRSADLQTGPYITQEEQARPLGVTSEPLFLHPLQRVISQTEPRIADNTDVDRSMDQLLQRFLTQFSGSADKTLPHVAIATGCLYKSGFARLNDLLLNPKIQEIRLLFSGRADRGTAELLEQVFLTELDQREIPTDPEHLYQSIEQGRLAIRVYPHTFLHAKLPVIKERPWADYTELAGAARLPPEKDELTDTSARRDAEAELNALVAYLYGLGRQEIKFLMDELFMTKQYKEEHSLMRDAIIACMDEG